MTKLRFALGWSLSYSKVALEALSGSVGHAAAFFRTALAGIGTVLAMVHVVLATLVATGLAKLCTYTA